MTSDQTTTNPPGRKLPAPDYVGRMAPTPSGFMHLGNAINFVLSWLQVRSLNGRLRLRVDDLDIARSRPSYLEDVFSSLEWLGLDWDDGPEGPAAQDQFSQVKRTDRYLQLIDQLIEKTDLVFTCNCSRRRLRSLEGKYDGHCYRLSHKWQEGVNSLKIRTPEAFESKWTDGCRGEESVSPFLKMRDFVIRRRDGLPAYQIASLADDLDFGTNIIMRGADLIPSTASQLFLASQLGENRFASNIISHHGLLTTLAGDKLSKSVQNEKQAFADRTVFMIKSIRETHSQPTFLYEWFSRILQLPEKAANAAELLRMYRSTQVTSDSEKCLSEHSFLTFKSLTEHPLHL